MCVCSAMSDSLKLHGLNSLPSSSVHGIFQARILEWVAISYYRVSGRSSPRIKSMSVVSPALAGRFFTTAPPINNLLNIYYLNICYACFLFKNVFLLKFIELFIELTQCCVSFRSIEGWVSYTYTYIHSFLDPFHMQALTEYWVEFPVLYNRSLLVICFIINY